MALPWQADFLDCDGGVWWPTQRPDMAVTDPQSVPGSKKQWSGRCGRRDRAGPGVGHPSRCSPGPGAPTGRGWGRPCRPRSSDLWRGSACGRPSARTATSRHPARWSAGAASGPTRTTACSARTATGGTWTARASTRCCYARRPPRVRRCTGWRPAIGSGSTARRGGPEWATACCAPPSPWTPPAGRRASGGVGDAARTLDPLSGQGLEVALTSAIRAAAALLGPCRARGLAEFARETTAQQHGHLAGRTARYRREPRWAGSPFWRRRQRPPELVAGRRPGISASTAPSS